MDGRRRFARTHKRTSSEEIRKHGKEKPLENEMVVLVEAIVRESYRRTRLASELRALPCSVQRSSCASHTFKTGGLCISPMVQRSGPPLTVKRTSPLPARPG